MTLERDLKVIHIGKCGGSTVCDGVKRSDLIKEKFKKVEIFHMRKPLFSENSHYLIIIRNPIDRAISAFNWRQKLVIEEKRQLHKNKMRREKEIAVLNEYKYLNQLAEDLYLKNSKPNMTLFKRFQSIRHIRENISFYLKTLLKSINSNQIYGIIKQNELSSDCNKLIGDIAIGNKKYNKSKIPNDPSLYLSLKAKTNLRKFFIEDFNCIFTLRNLDALNDEDFVNLTNF